MNECETSTYISSCMASMAGTDYFAELLENEKPKAGSVASGEPDLMFSEESPVLPLERVSEPAQAPAQAPGLPELDANETKSASPNGPSFKPMGEGRGKREARETQEIMEAIVGRFASGLQAVLEKTNRHVLLRVPNETGAARVRADTHTVRTR